MPLCDSHEEINVQVNTPRKKFVIILIRENFALRGHFTTNCLTFVKYSPEMNTLMSFKLINFQQNWHSIKRLLKTLKAKLFIPNVK